MSLREAFPAAPTPAARAAALDRTWLAMAAFAAVALFGVLARPLLPIDETRYLAVAWEMRLSGGWIVPNLNGQLYPDKPPLLFWLINLVWSVTGISETAGRLVAPAFGVGAIWATSRLATVLWPEDAGVGGRAAMVLAGFAIFSVFASLTMFDAMLTLAVILGVLALTAGGDSWRGWAGFGAALAFGVMSKGPVILVHLLPIALTAPLWAGLTVRRTLSGLGLGLALGLGLVGLWLVPALITGGPVYREAVLWTQSAGRMADSFAHARPWWFFLALVPALIWPFGWSLPLWRRIAALDWRGERGLRLALAWAGSALLLFSLMSGKQIHYLLPTLPAAALVFARAMRGVPPVTARAAAVPLVGLGLACIAVAFGFGAGGRQAAIFAPPAVTALAGVGFLALAVLVLRRLRGPDLAALGLGFAVIVNVVFLLGAPGRIYYTGTVAEWIAGAAPGEVAVIGADYNGEFTFTARLTAPVATLAPSEVDAWLAADPRRQLVARLDRGPSSPPPRATTVYRGRPYGVWGGAPAGTPDAQ